MEFSAKRLFLDSVSDPEHGRLRERRTHVRVEDAEVVWRILSTEDLGLLHMSPGLATPCSLLLFFGFLYLDCSSLPEHASSGNPAEELRGL